MVTLLNSQPFGSQSDLLSDFLLRISYQQTIEDALVRRSKSQGHSFCAVQKTTKEMVLMQEVRLYQKILENKRVLETKPQQEVQI